MGNRRGLERAYDKSKCVKSITPNFVFSHILKIIYHQNEPSQRHCICSVLDKSSTENKTYTSVTHIIWKYLGVDGGGGGERKTDERLNCNEKHRKPQIRIPEKVRVLWGTRQK